jgi:hypothetical protein
VKRTRLQMQVVAPMKGASWRAFSNRLTGRE